MAFLDWIKRGKAKRQPEHEPTPPHDSSPKGNPITRQWRSEWYSSEDGLHEFKHYVGRSIEGFHGGLKVDYHGSDDYDFRWSKKRPTQEAALRASYGMRVHYEGDDIRSQRSIGSAEKLFAEWRQDHQLAKERDQTGREPERRTVEADAAPAPASSKTLPRRERGKGHDIPF
jgi:hypothetical protein